MTQETGIMKRLIMSNASMAERSKAMVSSTIVFVLVGSNPTRRRYPFVPPAHCPLEARSMTYDKTSWKNTILYLCRY